MPGSERVPFEERHRVPARVAAVFVVYGVYYLLGSMVAHLVIAAGVLLVVWSAIDRSTMPRSEQQSRSERLLLGAGCAVAVAGAILTTV